MRVAAHRQQVAIRRRIDRIGERAAGNVGRLHALPLDEVLDRLDAVFELARAVEVSVAGAQRRLVGQLVDRRQPRGEVVLVRVVEVVRIGAEGVVLDEEGFGLAVLLLDDRVEVVAEAELQRQPAADTPRILREADRRRTAPA